ncbi:MAG TPA: DUF502 domain-containing protein [Chitinivibrionales bacterium]|nr:DUF502 domain-containing protein [Chitinivibrionales bacterium]
MYRLWHAFRHQLTHSLRQMRTNILAGFLLLLPIFASILILYKLFKLLDSWAYFAVPAAQRVHIVPGMGLVVLLAVAWFTGAVARNFIGRRLMKAGDSLLTKIPFFNKIYGILKQIVDAIASPKKKVFNKVVLIEFPEKGSYCLAFVTARENREISAKTGEKMVGVFLPKVPNPTAGFLIFVPESKLVEVDISVEKAIKLVVSGGVVSAERRQPVEETLEEPLTLASLGRLFRPGKRPPDDPRD